jgi:hypothetical protein
MLGQGVVGLPRFDAGERQFEHPFADVVGRLASIQVADQRMAPSPDVRETDCAGRPSKSS